MVRLPTVGGDKDNWGTILNQFLQVGHNSDGTLNSVQTVYNVKDYGAKGDGTTDDSTAIQNAVNACNAAGGGVVYFPPTPNSYLVNTAIKPLSNIIFRGEGIASLLTGDTASSHIFNWSDSSGTLSDVVFDKLAFLGKVNQTVSVPTRARTTSGNGPNCAIYIDGSLDTTGSYGVVTNITIKNCIVKNMPGLPIRIFGVSGKIIVTENEFTNCQDVGFGFNQEVICSNNHSYMSADNGFSISRGNQKVTCTGNTVELAAYYGIWLSGASGANGPQNFTCVGNTVKNVGNHGIGLQDAPSQGTIVGNTIYQGYNRGPVDAPNDGIYGVYVVGDVTSSGQPGKYSDGLIVSDNIIIAAPSGGIYLDGVKNFIASNNLLLDIGTQHLADGVTSISSSDTGQNIGIKLGSPNTVIFAKIYNNTIIDRRSTPYTNFAIQPLNQPSVFISNNTMINCRNASNLYSSVPFDKFGIGTLTPLQLLHIAGSSAIKRITNINQSGFAKVQEATNSVAGGTSISVSVSATGQNNLVILNVKFSDTLPTNISVTDNAGNTYALAGKVVGSVFLAAQFYGVQLTPGATSITISWTGTETARAIVEEFSGNAISNAAVFDTSYVNTGVAQTSANVQPFMASFPGSLVASFIGFRVSTSLPVAGSGYTIDFSNASQIVQYKLASSVIENAPASWTTASDWAEIVGVYKALEKNNWDEGYLTNTSDYIIKPTANGKWQVQDPSGNPILTIDTNGDKIGFYGVTPISRAVLATGASHTVDDVITALQNLGLVKQS